MKEIRVALVGYGRISSSHTWGYYKFASEGEAIRLVAICDIDESKLPSAEDISAGRVKLPEGINTYTNMDELLANEEFDMVDICLPSFLHKEATVKMLKAGKHVLCEKPMSLCVADCEEMIKVAKECDRRLMIGQCLRFSPEYLYLKECIDDGRFGKLHRLYMDRMSALPKWSWENWFLDVERSGSCIADLHIHDIDMARFLLGNPKSVSTVSYNDEIKWKAVNTRLFYEGITVFANGSWDEADGTPFIATYRACFDNATIVFNGKELVVYVTGKESEIVPLPRVNMYGEEIRFFAHTLLDESLENVCNPPESACESVRLVEALRRSADNDGVRVEF